MVICNSNFIYSHICLEGHSLRDVQSLCIDFLEKAHAILQSQREELPLSSKKPSLFCFGLQCPSEGKETAH